MTSVEENKVEDDRASDAHTSIRNGNFRPRPDAERERCAQEKILTLDQGIYELLGLTWHHPGQHLMMTRTVADDSSVGRMSNHSLALLISSWRAVRQDASEPKAASSKVKQPSRRKVQPSGASMSDSRQIEATIRESWLLRTLGGNRQRPHGRGRSSRRKQKSHSGASAREV